MLLSFSFGGCFSVVGCGLWESYLWVCVVIFIRRDSIELADVLPAWSDVSTSTTRQLFLRV